jgi:hypothetical protein
MKTIIKLNLFSWDETKNEKVLIGVQNIIDVKQMTLSRDNKKALVTQIQSVGAMVETNFVLESLDEIFEMINN